MRWTTGYPFGVNLSRGYPRFNPGEFSTVDLLVRGRQRRGADPRRRSGRDDAAARHRPPGAHPDDRAGPEGDAHEPAGSRAHHDGGHRDQRARARPTAWTRSRCRCGPPLKSPYPTDEEVVRRIRQAVAAKPAVDARPRHPGRDRDGMGSEFRVRIGFVNPSSPNPEPDLENLHAADHRRQGLRPGQRRRRRRQGHLHRRRPHRRRPSKAAARSTPPAWSSSPAAWTSTPTSPAPRSTSRAG